MDLRKANKVKNKMSRFNHFQEKIQWFRMLVIKEVHINNLIKRESQYMKSI